MPIISLSSLVESQQDIKFTTLSNAAAKIYRKLFICQPYLPVLSGVSVRPTKCLVCAFQSFTLLLYLTTSRIVFFLVAVTVISCIKSESPSMLFKLSSYTVITR